MRLRLLAFLLPLLAFCQTQIITVPVQQNVTDPDAANNPNDHVGSQVNCTTHSTGTNPNYSDENCVEINHNVLMGQALYGGGTNAKKTLIPLNVGMNATGSGQRIGSNFTINCYGMSDCAKESVQLYFAGGPIAGDEAQGFNVVSNLGQQRNLVRTTISSITANTCAATLQLAVAASKDPQNVTVDNTAGCGGWVVLGHAPATNTPNAEAVNVSVVDGVTLSGTFRANHPSGTLVLPSTVLTVGNTYQFGQDRILVNLSQPQYAAGTVASVSGGGFTGSGTGWSAGMVGGDATNPGCISLANDTYTGTPFSVASPLISWYSINPVASATSLGIYTTSVAGDGAYRGNGVGGGAYVIAPCAKVLYLPGGNTAVLDWNTFAWGVGDSVEEAIVPYPDVTGYQDYLSSFTPGGTYRGYRFVTNTGSRPFSAAYAVRSLPPCCVGGYGWGTGFDTTGAVTQTSFNAGNNLGGSFRSAPPAIGYDNALYPGGFKFGARTNADGSQMAGSGAMFGMPGYSTVEVYQPTNGTTVTQFNGASDLIQTNTTTARDANWSVSTYGANLLFHATGRGTFGSATPLAWGGRGWSMNIDAGDHPSDCAFFGETVVGLQQLKNATVSMNQPSCQLVMQGSVWNGTSAQGRFALATVVPEAGVNAKLNWRLSMECAPYNTSFPCQPFNVRETGEVAFGSFPAGYGADHRVTLDPTGLTAARRITVPDANGTLALQSPITASGLTCTITAITNGIITGATCQ